MGKDISIIQIFTSKDIKWLHAWLACNYRFSFVSLCPVLTSQQLHWPHLSKSVQHTHTYNNIGYCTCSECACVLISNKRPVCLRSWESCTAGKNSRQLLEHSSRGTEATTIHVYCRYVCILYTRADSKIIHICGIHAFEDIAYRPIVHYNSKVLGQ